MEKGMKLPAKLKPAQIGRCGELLVQYFLLLRGIESAPLTTDSGIDLVAYSLATGTPRTIQVKTNLAPKPGGGKGKLALDWWVEHKSPAQLVAIVDLSQQRVWLLEAMEFSSLAQQKSAKGFHLYFYLDSANKLSTAGKPIHISLFNQFLLENRVGDLF